MLPTIADICGPSYLVQIAPGNNLDKLDKSLLLRQTVFLARVLADAYAPLGKTMTRIQAILSSTLLVGAILGGCGASSSSASPVDPGAARLSKPSVGCGRPAGRSQAVDVARFITVDWISHLYLLSLPVDYSTRKPSPMVLEFHGYGGTARSMADLTQMPARGASRGYIVVTPDGPNDTWQLSGTGADAFYIDSLVTSITGALCVDTNRIYAAGFSQGAAFAIVYSCSHPHQIAAISTVAVDFRLGCSRPMPFLAFHGTSDPAVPYQDGGIGLSLPRVKVRGTILNMGDWARLDHCSEFPEQTKVGTDVQHTVWPHCLDGTEVGLYTVIGGGHTWPGADTHTTAMSTTEAISATDLMLAFFRRHHLH